VQAITVTTGGPVESTVDAFERLFKAEYGRVVGIANRVLGDRQEAEDVAQEVFVDFHRLHRPDAPYGPAWLHRAAANTALNSIRSRNRRARRETVFGATLGVAPVDPADAAVAAEDRLMVRRALGRLPVKSASVLALRHSGLSYAEVAQALGVGVGQVGTLLRRAEAALRREIENATS